MFSRYANKIAGKNVSSTYSLDSFTDKNNVSNYAKEQMKYIVEKGVITGNNKIPGQLRLLPKDNAKRSEAATMIMRFCQNVLGM
jgi:hypothetical protein